MSKLIALAAIAAGLFSELPEGVTAGAEFEVAPELAAQLQADGLAQLADPAPSAAPAAPTRTRNVKARVLADGVHGKVNDVVTVSAAVAKASDSLDADPDAVAYAESLVQ